MPRKSRYDDYTVPGHRVTRGLFQYILFILMLISLHKYFKLSFNNCIKTIF